MSARRTAARWLVALVFALATSSALGQAAAGAVVRLAPPRPVATGARIEVIEFFYYGCPLCYELEPLMTRWLATQAPEYVALRRIPALTPDGWEVFARLFFTLEAMGHISRLHWLIYDNFHFENKPLNEEPPMLDWVAKNGVDPGKFMELYRSPGISAKLTEVRDLMKSYDVRGVPTLVVDGKYLSSARLAGGTGALMQVVDELVRRARSYRPN